MLVLSQGTYLKEIPNVEQANEDIVWPILTTTFPESANSTEFAIDSICSESALCICLRVFVYMCVYLESGIGQVVATEV